MPNKKGGKGYKKGSNESTKQPECIWEDGQQFGRILKTLGNKRFRVLCNDGKERICKLAGSLRKSQWCEEGTFVILSLRGLSSGTSSISTEEVGDILDVVEHSFVSKLKKDDKINKILFGSEQQKGKETNENDDLFDENDSDHEEGKELNSESDTNEKIIKTVEEIEEEKKRKANAREKKNKERDQQRNARRDDKHNDGGEINIDAI